MIQTLILVKAVEQDNDGRYHAVITVTAPLELYVEVEDKKKPQVGTGATCEVMTAEHAKITLKNQKTYNAVGIVLNCGKEGKMLVQGLLFDQGTNK